MLVGGKSFKLVAVLVYLSCRYASKVLALGLEFTPATTLTKYSSANAKSSSDKTDVSPNLINTCLGSS